MEDNKIGFAASHRRVLSVQSSVVYGYVGNKVSVFALQLLGLHVDPINTVQLSNHTGYALFKGSKTTGDELKALTDGMQANGFLDTYSALLTGYMGTEDLITKFADFLDGWAIDRKTKGKPKLTYVCDPVLGDSGKLYVPESFIAVYRERLLQHATTVTPNQTEAELLSGLTITNIADAQTVCGWFHDRGVRNVVITSLTVAGSDDIHFAASTRTEATEEGTFSHGSFPQLECYFSGTGDLTAALILAWTRRLQGDVHQAVQHAIATVQALVKLTYSANSKELLLVEGKHDIENPPQAQFTTHTIQIPPVSSSKL